ncbi:hypothetical protein H072_7457 [Dactylellina haptotyla CBS 200.50]|uniref:Mob1/phocein n=1 Tax=Dactylellina haptotyla (strain CBS 200.50) TaxID=1284197 RepID=S8BU23_DACHA|nr:hypothetical protein H072_7457 [Dactylellina haptotyla CBS 200.50]
MSPASASDHVPISISTAPTALPAANIPTSPRLPSPPPPVEDLSNPTSPSFMPTPSSPSIQNAQLSASTVGNRRIRKGSKAKDILGPPLVPLSELDSAFQLQEHLAALLSSITNPPDSEHIIPLSRKDCEQIATCPEGIDDWMWCYELTRRLTRDLNHLVVGLLGDNCTEETCPEMRASLWQYLCAVHDPPRSCCAMDYSVHTLDHAASTLCSTKHFPSRLNINANGTKQLSSIFRRLYRIFAHAWFLHRSVFWDVENEHGLYVFFRIVSDKYNLIPEDNLTIPSTINGGYDGIVAEDGNDLNRMEMDSRISTGHDSDLEDDIDQDMDYPHDEEGDVPVILNDEAKARATDEDRGEKPEPSQLEVTIDGVQEDFPLFVFPGEDHISVSDETKQELDGKEPHAIPLAFQPDQTPLDGHQIEMRLDIQEVDNDQVNESTK